MLSKIVTLYVVVLAALLIALAVDAIVEHHAHPAPATACAEDDQCWDCATMGNLTCGPRR